MFGRGISLEGDLVDLGTELGIIQKSGTWFTWGKERLGQGRKNAKSYFMENPKSRSAVENEIRKAVNITVKASERKGAITAPKGALPASKTEKNSNL